MICIHSCGDTSDLALICFRFCCTAPGHQVHLGMMARYSLSDPSSVWNLPGTQYSNFDPEISTAYEHWGDISSVPAVLPDAPAEYTPLTISSFHDFHELDVAANQGFTLMPSYSIHTPQSFNCDGPSQNMRQCVSPTPDPIVYDQPAPGFASPGVFPTYEQGYAYSQSVGLDCFSCGNQRSKGPTTWHPS